jgi:glycosyltransferase involved in cell wall biosynthesis
MYIILVDWIDNGDFFLHKELLKTKIEHKIIGIPDYNINDRVTKIGSIRLYFKYLKLAFKAVKQSTNKDVIVCWNFTTSIAVGIVCIISKRQRKIIGLNIIAPPLKGILEKLRNTIFGSIMRNQNFLITVNSKEYIKDYGKRFNIKDIKFQILNDPFLDSENLLKFSAKQSFIFCGGEAHRDFETLFLAAKRLPDIQFVCIARRKFFSSSIDKPDNVELFFDTTHSFFYEKMNQCSLVAITLNSTLPCGLIILLKAASLGKPVIATRTPSISNYIINGYTGFLVEKKDVSDLVEKIELIINDITLQSNIVNNMQNHLKVNHSEKRYTKNLIKIIDQI